MTKARNKNFNSQLLHRLSDAGWKLENIEEGEDWRSLKHWTISSIRQQYGMTLKLDFILDPMDQKSVWKIEVTKDKKNCEEGDQNIIANLYFQKGNLGRNIYNLLSELETYRSARKD